MVLSATGRREGQLRLAKGRREGHEAARVTGMRQFARLRGAARVISRPGPVSLSFSLHRPPLIVLLLKARATPSPGPPRGMSLCHLVSRPRADLKNFLFV